MMSKELANELFEKFKTERERPKLYYDFVKANTEIGSTFFRTRNNENSSKYIIIGFIDDTKEVVTIDENGSPIAFSCVYEDWFIFNTKEDIKNENARFN